MPSIGADLGLFLLAQDPVHLRAAGRAGALGSPPAVRELDFLAIELSFLTALYAVALVRSHDRLLLSSAHDPDCPFWGGALEGSAPIGSARGW
jgi:hypothetical protein